MESADCHRHASTTDQSAWPNGVTVKEEREWGACGVSEAAARAGLYAGHEVKDELVVGPELLQPQDSVYSIQVPSLNQKGLEDIKQEPSSGARPGERPRAGDARQRQHALRACSVRLQRMPVDNNTHSCNTYLQTSKFGSSILTETTKLIKREETNLNTKKYIKELQDDTQKNIYVCGVCGKKIVRKNLLIKHMKMHNIITKNSCVMCKKVFKSYSTLKRHSASHIHMDENVLACDICGKQFKYQSNYNKHKKKHTGLKSDNATYSTLTPRVSLSKHVQTHIKEKPYSCKICYKQFSCKTRLNRHKLIHTGENRNSCQICKKKFVSKANLSRHMRIHTGEKPYLCEFCIMQFNDVSTLNKHKLIHTGKKPHSCEICKRKFRGKSDLTKHLRTHTGEKPYSCDICKKRFSQTFCLDQHKRLHTREKPYLCEICDMRFTQQSALDRHLRRHTGEKPYECEISNMQFRHKSSLGQHKRRHTREARY